MQEYATGIFDPNDYEAQLARVERTDYTSDVIDPDAHDAECEECGAAGAEWRDCCDTVLCSPCHRQAAGRCP